MTAPPLTPAQRAALEWLPASDAQAIAAKSYGWFVSCCVLSAIGYAQCRVPGNWRNAKWRITPAGEALRKELNDA